MRKWLVELREKHNMSQQEVADKLNITRQYYNLIENGLRQKKMDFQLAVKISELFHISLDDIRKCENSKIRV